MTRPLTVECNVQFHRCGRGARRALQVEPEAPGPAPLPGRVPRVSRLMALAIRFDRLLREGMVSDYAEIAELGHVTRARVSQIMNLLQLAPPIQEELLFLPRTQSGRDAIHLAELQPIACVPDWRKQRKLWQALRGPLPALA